MSKQIRKEALKEITKWRWIAYSIIFPATGLLLWSSILLNDTFIETSFMLLSGLLGGLVGIVVFTFLWSKIQIPFWVILFYGILSGTSIPVFSIAASNYYLKDNAVFQEQLDIIKTGNRSRRRSACKTPYAIVVYEGVEKELPFSCVYEKNISDFKQVKLKLSKGFLGFDVIRSKELIPQ